MKKFRVTLIVAILLGVLFASVAIYTIESEKRELSEDLIELSKVKYGMFSVDEWEEVLSEIIIKRINDFDLEDTNKDKMREKISGFLQVAIDELEVAYDDKKGLLQRVGASVFDVFGHMEEEIPTITEGIIDFMNDPENRERIKEYLLNKMNEYSEDTFSEIDYSLYDQILAEQGVDTKEDAIEVLELKVDSLATIRSYYSVFLFGMVVLLFLGVAFTKDIHSIEYAFLTLICIILLMVGILLPMINIDARISEMNFQLMGESITFTDQVLYFKSKSILEVVTLMLSNSKIDVKLVGFLVLLFSVLFPFSKLISSLIYLFSEKAKNSKVVSFLVFKTAKWSMADVMVVAIFMAYIGFSGIISEQLADIEKIAKNLDILTTNASSLQVGFFIFTSFAVLSLIISHKLQYRLKNSEAS
ncbi:MAG: paraquat-inducible protein A [Balneolaceae bacterium]